MELFELIKRLGAFGMETEFLFCMLLIYANMFVYGLDFYKLVKKKSAVETLAIVLCPAIFIATGIIMLTIMVNIPFSEELDRLLPLFDSERLWKELLMLACLFWFIFAVAYQMWQSRRVTKKETVKWLLSYALDFLSSAMLLGVGIYYLSTKKNPFRQSWLMAQEAGAKVNLFFFLFLNGAVMLLVKEVLIALSVAVRLYTGQITVFHYHEGKNPVGYLARYILFYQNAVVRGMVPALLLYAWIIGILAKEVRLGTGDAGQAVFMILFLCATVLFLTAIVLSRILTPLGRLRKWGDGDRKKMAEQFCREYFLEEAVRDSEDYRITRSFLVDQGRPLQIFRWENLNGLREIVQKKKNQLELCFSDGSVCIMPLEGQNKVICDFARDYYESRHAQDKAGQRKSFEMKAEGAAMGEWQQQQMPAQKWVVFFIICMFLLFSLMRMLGR